MYNISELSSKAHIELIEIAKELGIARATRMDAQSLIYKILDTQANNPTKEDEQQEEKQRQRRTRLKPVPVAESNVKNFRAHKDRIAAAAKETEKQAALMNQKKAAMEAQQPYSPCLS